MVALVATAESLYFSELRGFIPCTLCWYQRILTYPLVLLLGIALLLAPVPRAHRGAEPTGEMPGEQPSP